ncbi:Avirulence (Avh) protein [Phytophthora megakarya]|uniref:Avirulence (Avh) protein n=1 Tax=Phytophthora megakarya TaxID=4795 RepID=A0A225V6C6_9STRA|nr:Avirulence (Avh) protein [Phytophthora megakarya]
MFLTSKVTPEKLENWLKQGKSADVVFERLHLHAVGRRLFNEPQFNAWVQYADELSVKIPGMSAISTLTRQYGDEVLFRMIETAKKSSDTESLATKLETQQMQHWLRSRKDPDEVFHLFEVDNLWGNILKKTEFTAWSKYVDNLNTNYPEEPMWMYATLSKRYDDEVLFKMIKEAKLVEEYKTIAIKLEDEWFQVGLQRRKIPYKALIDLGLGKSRNTLVGQLMDEKSLANIWVKYLQAFNMRYPDQKTTTIQSLTNSFGDVDVTTMLHTAKMDIWTRNLASQLEVAQVKMWLDSGKTTDDVFKLLKLDKQAISFQNKVLLNTWISYINAFIKENPNKKITLFSALEIRFKDRQLNEILNVAKKFPGMESIATKIQTVNIQPLFARNESPRHVFTLLGLNDEGDHILSSPLFQTWMKYVEDFNKLNPKKQESWFDPLRIEYEYGGTRIVEMALQNPSTVQIGKKVEREWLNFWLDREKLPKDVFNFLELDKAGEKALTDRKFNAWIKYLDLFNERFPGSKTTMIDGLRASNNDLVLLRMFDTAKTDPSTEKVVAYLENELVHKWLVEKVPPTLLYNKVGHIKSSGEMIERYIKKLAATEHPN